MKKIIKENSIEEKLARIIEVINKNQRFFLAGHINPDGDTIGSMLAISSVLRRLGKKTYLFSHDPVPENLGFSSEFRKIKVGCLPKAPYEVMILLECSTLKRAGNLRGFEKKAKQIINIDHHKTAVNFGDINLVDSTSSSTAEIIYRLFERMGVRVNQKEARYLYVGIVTDTGRFQFPSTNSGTHMTAARLLETGFNFANVNKYLYATSSFPSLKILGKALASLELSKSGRTALMFLKKEDFLQFNASVEHSENIINYGMMIPGVKISVLFREEPGRVSVTFRSKGKIDISLVARRFGGGGHKYAAGCRLKMPFDEVVEKIRAVVLEIEK